ncbi:MAG: MFS transporter [Burkholderiales bacterium RIFCSPLOWO2_02_FULL_57_36]|nr:MAG: MFS transporter [Burkholderiales bacterium RIFCSPLOWO2_02_FULL_57_36]
MVAEQTVLFAVPLMIYQSTRDIRFSGYAFALEWLPALLAYPFAGLLADAIGGRRLFMSANIARAICLALAVPLCLAIPSMTVWVLMACGVVLSILMAPIRMSVEKTVPLMAAGDDLPRWQSLVQNMELLSMVLGPALAAFLAYYIGKLPLLGVAAAALLIAAWCWRSVPTTVRAPLPLNRVGADLKLGWQLLLANRPVRLLASLNFSINLAFAVTLSANAFIITGTFGASDSVFGLVNAAAGGLALLNLLLIPRLLRSMTVYQLGALGFSLLCGGLLAMGLSSSVALYAPAFLVAMAGVALFNVFNRTQRVRAINPSHLGKVMGPFYLLNLLSYPLGGILTASLGHSMDVRQLVLLLAIVLALPGSALLWLTFRRFREKLEPIPLLREASL